MNRLKLIILAISMLSLNSFAVESTNTNFQVAATLNPTCSINTSFDPLVMPILPNPIKQGKLVGAGGFNLILMCTNSTTVSMDIIT